MTVLFVFTTFTVLTLIACTIAVPGLLILWGVLVAGVGLAWAIVEVFGDA